MTTYDTKVSNVLTDEEAAYLEIEKARHVLRELGKSGNYYAKHAKGIASLIEAISDDCTDDIDYKIAYISKTIKNDQRIDAYKILEESKKYLDSISQAYEHLLACAAEYDKADQ